MIFGEIAYLKIALSHRFAMKDLDIEVVSSSKGYLLS